MGPPARLRCCRAFSLRKEFVNGPPHLFEPCLPLRLRTRYDDTEYLPVEGAHAAQAEHAVPPDRLERIAEDLPFPRGQRVGGIKHDRCPGFQQPLRNALAGIALQKLVGNPGAITRSIQPFRTAGGWPHQFG